MLIRAARVAPRLLERDPNKNRHGGYPEPLAFTSEFLKN